MKYIIILMLVGCVVGCAPSDDILLGVWAVHDKFFSATYQVEKSGRVFKGLILSYDDGTTRYQRSGNETHYVFTNLKERDGIYVDGISGATVKTEQTARLSIQPIHQDTLSVTTNVMGHPHVETWTRKSK